MILCSVHFTIFQAAPVKAAATTEGAQDAGPTLQNGSYRADTPGAVVEFNSNTSSSESDISDHD